jgi:hypothetical protein
LDRFLCAELEAIFYRKDEDKFRWCWRVLSACPRTKFRVCLYLYAMSLLHSITKQQPMVTCSLVHIIQIVENKKVKQ